MLEKTHFERLVSMYYAGPVNKIYQPVMEVFKGEAHIEIKVDDRFCHAAGGVHGSIYFKMLDDAAYFAANSLETRFFLLTSSFTIYFIRPVSSGIIKSVGRVLNQGKNQFICESVVYDNKEREIGRGSGVFVRSNTLLTEADGY
ncbi:MAG: thioesterase [Deltaproteobacteria bacterium]|nr:MAG: thioesterase [Deltaproteobacteria bacterium]